MRLLEFVASVEGDCTSDLVTIPEVPMFAAPGVDILVVVVSVGAFAEPVVPSDGSVVLECPKWLPSPATLPRLLELPSP